MSATPDGRAVEIRTQAPAEPVIILPFLLRQTFRVRLITERMTCHYGVVRYVVYLTGPTQTADGLDHPRSTGVAAYIPTDSGALVAHHNGNPAPLPLDYVPYLAGQSALRVLLGIGFDVQAHSVACVCGAVHRVNGSGR